MSVIFFAVKQVAEREKSTELCENIVFWKDQSSMIVFFNERSVIDDSMLGDLERLNSEFQVNVDGTG